MQHLLLLVPHVAAPSCPAVAVVAFFFFYCFAGTVQQIMKMRLAGKQERGSRKNWNSRADHINLNAIGGSDRAPIAIARQWSNKKKKKLLKKKRRKNQAFHMQTSAARVNQITFRHSSRL